MECSIVDDYSALEELMLRLVHTPQAYGSKNARATHQVPHSDIVANSYCPLIQFMNKAASNATGLIRQIHCVLQRLLYGRCTSQITTNWSLNHPEILSHCWIPNCLSLRKLKPLLQFSTAIYHVSNHSIVTEIGSHEFGQGNPSKQDLGSFRLRVRVRCHS